MELKITENHINGAFAIASVVGMVWLASVVVDSAQYRKEMACRDNWKDGRTPEQCAEILNKMPAPQPGKDARVLL